MAWLQKQREEGNVGWAPVSFRGSHTVGSPAEDVKVQKLQSKLWAVPAFRCGSGLSREGTHPLRDGKGAVSQLWHGQFMVLCLWKKLTLKKRNPLYLRSPNGSTSSQGARVSLPSRLSGISSPPDLYWKVSLSQMTSINPANVNGWNIFKGVPLILGSHGVVLPI